MTVHFEEPEETLCDSCEEPITLDRPGHHWRMRNTEASIFPYNGMGYSVVLHDYDPGGDEWDCVRQYFEDDPQVRGEIDEPVVVP